MSAVDHQVSQSKMPNPYLLFNKMYVRIKWCAVWPILSTCSLLGHQERREREQQDLEFAKEMAEDDDDSFP